MATSSPGRIRAHHAYSCRHISRSLAATSICAGVQAVVLLVWTGAVKPKAMREKRAYVIVGAFVIGMLLTPPDIISQTLLALPMWLLFEVGVFMGEYFAPKREEDSNDSGHEEYEPPSDEEMEAELDRIDAEEEGRKPE